MVNILWNETKVKTIRTDVTRILTNRWRLAMVKKKPDGKVMGQM